MANEEHVYIERTPEGVYAVRLGNSQRASAIAPTQEAAIERAREMHPGSAIHVERVEYTTGGSPDRWRRI